MAANVAMIEGLGGMARTCLLNYANPTTENPNAKSCAIYGEMPRAKSCGMVPRLKKDGTPALKKGRPTYKRVCQKVSALTPTVDAATGKIIQDRRRWSPGVARSLRSSLKHVFGTKRTAPIDVAAAVTRALGFAKKPSDAQIANANRLAALSAEQRSARLGKARNARTGRMVVGYSYGADYGKLSPARKAKAQSYRRTPSVRLLSAGGAADLPPARKAKAHLPPVSVEPVSTRRRGGRKPRSVAGLYGLGNYGYKAGRCYDLSRNRFAKSHLCGGKRAGFRGVESSDDVALDLGDARTEMAFSEALGRDVQFFAPQGDNRPVNTGYFGAGFGAFGGVGIMPLVGIGIGGVSAAAGIMAIRKFTTAGGTVSKLAGLIGAGVGAAIAGALYLIGATKSAAIPAALSAAIVGLFDVAQVYLIKPEAGVGTQAPAAAAADGLSAIVADRPVGYLGAIVPDQVQGLAGAPGVQVLQGNDNEITVLPMAFGAVPLAGY